MKLITINPVSDAEVLTMSSLEMVGYINSTRVAGEAEIRHDNVLAKVPKVLGVHSTKFLGEYKDRTGRTLKCYNFPKREAMLMAMSYSYELQAQIFDAWEAAENLIGKAAAKPIALIPNFDNPIEAAEAWITEKKANLALTNEISIALPKVAFHDAVVADDTTYSLAEASKILGFKPRAFNQVLRAGGYLMTNNVAYQYYIGLGVFSMRYSGFVLDNGTFAPATSRVTSKGITFLQKKLTANVL